MNSLNILSSRVVGQASSVSSPSRSRSRSHGDIFAGSPCNDLAKSRSYSEQFLHGVDGVDEKALAYPQHQPAELGDEKQQVADEKTPLLLRDLQKPGPLPARGTLSVAAQRLFDVVAETVKVILSTLVAPGVYVIRSFRDDDGRYSLMTPLRKLRRVMPAPGRSSIKGNGAEEEPSRTSRSVTGGKGGGGKGGLDRSSPRRGGGAARKPRNSVSRDSIVSSTSESEIDRQGLKVPSNSGRRHTRSKSHHLEPVTDDGTPRRSIRIKLHNEEALQRRKQRRSQSADIGLASNDDALNTETVTAETLKSPTSPLPRKVTKYPHAPTPPRPLVPPRQPSYTVLPSGRHALRVPQKTLVVDLDETLIHSLAKGGRMSSGHMVEVKLAAPMTASVGPGAPPTTLGPQHPILYYVHKRPHCDEFLRKVCRWYKLVVFTASVQEYADPVIDWLEQERKFFQARYYRQHCTVRNGAYIKDLSSVEPDLSKVMILDNSPMSYIFHEDNAIPIEGWINDPTDNGLLHLIPMLEALQHATDVRALLALRRGEADS